MSSVHTLRQFVNDRLAAAAQEIFAVFQQTVSELVDELDRQRKLLDGLLKQPVVRLPNICSYSAAGCEQRDKSYPLLRRENCLSEQQNHRHKDVQQLPVAKLEESLELQKHRPCLDPEEPDHPHYKDGTLGNVSSVQVKKEDCAQREVEPPTCSFTIKAEIDGDHCGRLEPVTYSGPLLLSLYQRTLSDSDTDNSEDWRKSADTQTGSNSGENPAVSERSDEKSPRCSRCSRVFTCVTSLRDHQKACSRRPFTCLLCGKSFRMKGNLKAHMISHTGEKPFSCPQCGKCFNRRHILKNHLRTHSGEKPYSCSQCGHCFKWKVQLKNHLTTHTGEKPFGCSLCGKCFNRRDNLKTHMRIHSGEKPFPCSRCGRRFTTSGNRKKHERSHGGSSLSTSQ
ncbi:uncharacterized protein ACB058_006726 [Synchiropus picturatus]